MKISIAMTTYNGAKYLIEQMDSIRLQTREPDEVIIVDDNSQDETVEVIEAYISRYNLVRWRLIKNKINVGFKKNFSIALQETKGELIFLCDQDDVWYLDKIQQVEDVFIQNERILLLATSFDIINEEGVIVKQIEEKGKSNNNLLAVEVEPNTCVPITSELLIKNGNFAQGCCTAFRDSLKDLYLDISENRGPHDFELNILASDLDGGFFYNKKMIGYRVHSNNTIGLMNATAYSMDKKFDKEFRLSFDKKENLELMKYLVEKNRQLQEEKKQKKIELLKAYILTYEKRNKYLNENCMAKLGMLNFSKYYRGLFPLKSRVADMICCIRG